MFEDPIQKKLKQMEMENPSENYHPKSFLESFSDRLFFLRRAITGNDSRDSNYEAIGADIFNIKPLKYELGVPLYTAEELSDLANKEFPTTITASGRWANNLKYSRIKEALSALRNPTHVIYFSPVEGGLYRFDVKHA